MVEKKKVHKVDFTPILFFFLFYLWFFFFFGSKLMNKREYGII